MKTAVVVIAAVAAILAVLFTGVLMVCVIRIQQQDEKLDDLRRDIGNLQQGGEELTRRMNRCEQNAKQ